MQTYQNKMYIFVLSTEKETSNAEVQLGNGLLVNRKKERVDLGRPFSILEHLQL